LRRRHGRDDKASRAQTRRRQLFCPMFPVFAKSRRDRKTLQYTNQRLDASIPGGSWWLVRSAITLPESGRVWFVLQDANPSARQRRWLAPHTVLWRPRSARWLGGGCAVCGRDRDPCEPWSVLLVAIPRAVTAAFQMFLAIQIQGRSLPHHGFLPEEDAWLPTHTPAGFQLPCASTVWDASTPLSVAPMGPAGPKCCLLAVRSANMRLPTS